MTLSDLRDSTLPISFTVANGFVDIPILTIPLCSMTVTEIFERLNATSIFYSSQWFCGHSYLDDTTVLYDCH